MGREAGGAKKELRVKASRIDNNFKIDVQAAGGIFGEARFQMKLHDSETGFTSSMLHADILKLPSFTIERKHKQPHRFFKCKFDEIILAKASGGGGGGGGGGASGGAAKA